MKWDERAGAQVLANYPTTVSVSDKTFMQIVGTHEYSGESGVVSLLVGNLNIASYYSGPESGYYLLLLLNLDEDPDLYEGGLVEVARLIFENIDDDAYIEMIPSLYRRLSIYPTLTKEQNLAFTLQDEIKRMIINRLREEGVVSKSELTVWLKDKYIMGFFDLDGILLELIKREIVKEASVKGMASSLVFLTNDILIFRTPPNKLLKDPIGKGLPEDFVKEYESEVKKFFLGYRPTEEDNLKLLEVIANPQVYETLRLLRIAIITMNDIEKLKKKGVDEIDEVLRILTECELIYTFLDKSDNKYYALNSDIHLDLTFPSFMLEVINSAYKQKSKSGQVLIEYLNILEEAYNKLEDKTMYSK
jgi:DNA-binding transcriptional ArsR family regulator